MCTHGPSNGSIGFAQSSLYACASGLVVCCSSNSNIILPHEGECALERLRRAHSKANRARGRKGKRNETKRKEIAVRYLSILLRRTNLSDSFTICVGFRRCRCRSRRLPSCEQRSQRRREREYVKCFTCCESHTHLNVAHTTYNVAAIICHIYLYLFN